MAFRLAVSTPDISEASCDPNLTLILIPTLTLTPLP